MPFENADFVNAKMQYDHANSSCTVIPTGNEADVEVPPEHTNCWVNEAQQSEVLDSSFDETPSGPFDVVNNMEEVSEALLLGKESTQIEEAEVDDTGRNKRPGDSPTNLASDKVYIIRDLQNNRELRIMGLLNISMIKYINF